MERALDVVRLPFRVLASIAAPVGALQAAETAAGAERRSARDEADLELHRRVEARVRAAAMRASGLPPGVGSVQAEVIGHDDGDLDLLRLRVAEPERVARGMPVVAGAGYVGVVVRVPGEEPAAPFAPSLLARASAAIGLERLAVAPPTDVVFVELITGREARVGALIERDEDELACRMVIGGLAPRDDELQLAVHNPERRAVERGTVLVDEPLPTRGQSGVLPSGLAYLANGYLVGQLARDSIAVRGAGTSAGAGATREVLGVRPWLDYEAGLHQVLVLTPDGRRSAVAEGASTVLEGDGWLPARFFVRAEPSARREGWKLDHGRRHGVRVGAALTTGARLVGRVVRAGLVTSDVLLPGDEGFAFNAIAEPLLPGTEGAALPVLGRAVSLGRLGDGRVELAVTLHRDLAAAFAQHATAAGEIPVRVWTGSGEAGVPRGLLVGTASLPTKAGRHVLRLEQADGVQRPRGLRVRVDVREGGTP